MSEFFFSGKSDATCASLLTRHGFALNKAVASPTTVAVTTTVCGAAWKAL